MKISLPYKCRCEGASPTLAPYASAVSNLLFYGTFWSKGGCRAATPALAGGAREKQEQRLATT